MSDTDSADGAAKRTPEPSRRKRLWIVGIGALAALLLVCGFVLARFWGGGFTVAGSITIYSTVFSGATMGQCSGGGLERGGPVKIAADGKTVALGRLDQGEPSDDRCVMRFTIDDVDDGHDFYSITIGDKPPMEYSRDDLDMPLDLTVE